MEVDNIISYVNLAGMLIAPVGFFFWVKFKIGQTDETLLELKMNLKEELLTIKHGKTAMKKELEGRIKEYKADQKEVNDGLKSDIAQLRADINTSKSEILSAISNIKK